MVKRKILFVSHFPHYRMGGQRSMIALAENLSKDKFECHFLINGDGPLESYLSSKGFQCHIVRMYPLKPKNYLKVLGLIWIIIRLIRQHNYDIIHPDYERDALVCGTACLFTTALMIWHVRLTRPTRQDKLIFPLANRVIAISEGAKQRFKEFKSDNLDKVRVIYNGVDTDQFMPREKISIRSKLGLPKDRKLVIFVGQITLHKGVFDILKCAAELKTQDSEVIFLFCGEYSDDETRSRFDYQINQDELDNIILLGQRENIYEYLAASDILVLPSHEGNEGMGRVIFEAMSCGCVPIASNISGVRDAITDETGVLIPEQSPSDLSKAIKNLFSDPEKLKRMIENGRTRAVEVFSIKIHAQEVESVYEEALGQLE